MRLQPLKIALACGGALAYGVGKVELALRGEIGMPGFPAPPSAYEEVSDVAAAQLGNAAMGLVLLVLTAALLWPPERTLVRRILLGVNWLGLAMIGAGVVGFFARATELAPGLGEPAEGATAWISLGVGAVWTVSWALAILGAKPVAGPAVLRGRTTPAPQTPPGK